MGVRGSRTAQPPHQVAEWHAGADVAKKSSDASAVGEVSRAGGAGRKTHDRNVQRLGPYDRIPKKHIPNAQLHCLAFVPWRIWREAHRTPRASCLPSVNIPRYNAVSKPGRATMVQSEMLRVHLRARPRPHPLRYATRTASHDVWSALGMIIRQSIRFPSGRCRRQPTGSGTTGTQHLRKCTRGTRQHA